MKAIAASAIVDCPITEPKFDRHISDGEIYIAFGVTSKRHRAMKKDWWPVGPVEK